KGRGRPPSIPRPLRPRRGGEHRGRGARGRSPSHWGSAAAPRQTPCWSVRRNASVWICLGAWAASIANSWDRQSTSGFRVSYQHHALSSTGSEEDDAGGFERAAHLIARVVPDLEPVGLQPLQGGER